MRCREEAAPPVRLGPLDPSQWEPHAVFRESFLCLRLSEALAELGRELGWRLYRETLERFDATALAGADPVSRALMAAARDLRQLEGFLGALGDGSARGSQDQQRAQIARHVSASLSRLATTLEAASR